MPAGRAFKPPGPASFELNTTNHSVILSAPLAPLPTRSAFYRRNFQVPRRYQHDLSVEHDGLHGGDLRVQGGEAGPEPRIQLDRRSSSSSRATTRTGPRSPGRRGLRAGDKASGHWRPQLFYGTGCVLNEDTCEAGDHGLSAPSGAPMAWGISCSLGDSTSEADPTSQKPHEEAHLTEVREVPTIWRTDFELGKALRARQGGQQGRWCSLCWFCKNQHDKR